MPSNILPQGDDIRWKKEVDRVIDELVRKIRMLEALVKANN